VSFHRAEGESWAYYVIDYLRGHGGEEQQKGRKRHRWGGAETDCPTYGADLYAHFHPRPDQDRYVTISFKVQVRGGT
jgi:hypothetical protein